MNGWFSSISSGGSSENSTIFPLFMMQQISSRQQGQVEWCLHHLIRQGMQKLCLHSSIPNSYSVFERQMAHFSVVLSATSMIFFILLAILGLMEGSVLLDDVSVALFLLASVGHFLERLRVYLLDIIVYLFFDDSARSICWDVEQRREFIIILLILVSYYQKAKTHSQYFPQNIRKASNP